MSPSVAVIGLGAIGLVTLKNLLEEGYNATGYEQNSYIGGLWHYTEENKTSVLKTTVVNISKQRGCFTDFPFPEGTKAFPTASEVQQYLLDYAEHFNLAPHIKLNHTVQTVNRDERTSSWVLDVTDGNGNVRSLRFDKVVVANGANHSPKIPTLEGLHKFKGSVIHSVGFKRPQDFKDLRVLVVGIGNTAADTATSLIGHAKSIHLGHRTGSFVLPRRTASGQPFDHGATYRKTCIQYFLMNNFPRLADYTFDRFSQSLQDAAYKMRPEWKLSPAPSIIHHVPIISDNFISGLENGQIISVANLKQILSDFQVELEDGETIEIDVIIWCTGYNTDYGILGDINPTLTRGGSPPVRADRPRLYRNIFSLQHPESLAIVGTVAFPSPAFQLYDLASMAIAQSWKDPSLLPSKPEMEMSVEAHFRWGDDILTRGPLNPRWVHAPAWMAWAEETAGVHVSEHLGYGIKGWNFWIKNRNFCNLLQDGILSPHLYRLFPSDRRKAWSGAREAIEQVNKNA